ncbi:MAG: hypothetical protein E7599_03635 [Ruminococcaceae bacterium]|nr:hypothetical protein [Oscillospiraceae bacterium]
MKKVLILFFMLLITISSTSVLGYADEIVVPSTKIETLEEYQQWQIQNPPLGGIVWDDFSILGKFTPQHAQEASPETLLYSYDSGERVYKIRIADLSISHTMTSDDSHRHGEGWEDAVQYWNEILPVIDQMTIKEYREAFFLQPECEDIAVGSPYEWIDPEEVGNFDLTIYKDSNSNGSFDVFVCANDNLAFKYDKEGLVMIEWVHKGMIYQLHCQDKHGDTNRYEYFNETDIDIVRRLTNLETCEEALNELMSEISDNAVAEMPKGMPRDELPNGSDENKENKDGRTDSVLPWVFLGAAGVLVLATALGILLHSRKKH